MRSVLAQLVAAAFLLTGCQRITGTAARLAENVRTATEQMAFHSDERNAQREARIDPNVGELRRAPALKLVERYETREGPDGLFIYDTERHSIARIDSQTQQGLSIDEARTALDTLNAADLKQPRD